MSSALEIFRAQRAEVEQIHARLMQVAELLSAIRSEANVLAKDESLRMLLQEEQTWLRRAEDLVRAVLNPSHPGPKQIGRSYTRQVPQSIDGRTEHNHRCTHTDKADERRVHTGNRPRGSQQPHERDSQQTAGHDTAQGKGKELRQKPPSQMKVTGSERKSDREVARAPRDLIMHHPSDSPKRQWNTDKRNQSHQHRASPVVDSQSGPHIVN